MSESTRRAAGAMTRAMSAQRGSDDQPRVLRVGILQENAVLEERVIRERADVSAGTTERATLAVSGVGFPSHVELFVVREGRWHLRFDRGAEGRVALAEGVRSLAEWAAAGRAKDQGGAWLLALDDASRGKVTVAGVTFLFQFVPAPPAVPRPQVPMALRRSLARDMDWRYNTSLASFLTLAMGALAWVEYGYDPVVDDRADALAYLAPRVRMAPVEDDSTEPAPRTDEGAATEAPSDRPTDTASRPNERPAPRNTAPGVPSNAAQQRVAQRAEEAAASAIRAMEASFAAITAPTAGPGSAVDQLHSQVLMTATAEDLRQTTGISTRAQTGPSRAVIAANNIPGGQTLGRHQTVATREEPTTGTLTGPVGPRRPPTITPSEPSSDTCDGDAGAVARVLRNNIGGVRSCYERSIRTNPTLRGRLELHFTVGETGRVTAASVRGVDPDLDECVERAVRRLVFPVPACGVAEYEYPINVDPAD